MTRRAAPAGVLVLHKAIDVLDALRDGSGGTSLAALSARLGMPKPTVYRILATLEARGYVERPDRLQYRLSRRVFPDAHDSASQQRLLEAARVEMQKLLEVTKETLNLGVLDGGEVLVVETMESPQAVRMSSKIGNRRYPHSTALGKVLLADLPQREVLRIVRGKGMPRFTPATIKSEEALLVELERVRAQGWALDNAENERDGRCIAAPVFDARKKVIAALSVSGPLPRMTTLRAKGFLKSLLPSCRRITGNL